MTLKSSSNRSHSSSNRDASITDAVIVRENRNLGPIRLPEHRAEDFISLFNRLYDSVGLGLQKQENEKKIPDSPKTGGNLIDNSSASATDHVS
jgi:hypothetical protein